MELKEIQERMHSGRIYLSADPVLLKEQVAAQELLYDYNHSRPSEGEKRQKLLHQMMAQCGENSFIEPPFFANWGGRHVHLGSEVYANVFLSLVDDSHIYIEDHVMIGPHVTICSGTHPVCPELRIHQAQYNLPVRIKRNAWIGGGSFLMPGVTVGENSIIGAGSVVLTDIPDNVIAVGSPARILRRITDRDREFYDHDKPIDLNICENL